MTLIKGKLRKSSNLQWSAEEIKLLSMQFKFSEGFGIG